MRVVFPHFLPQKPLKLHTTCSRIGALVVLFFLPFLTSGCGGKQAYRELPPERKQEILSYWYDGAAEISSYNLTQYRYGEPRSGSAVLIFVTEDFLTSTQVKKEGPTNEPSASVLKMNATKNYLTGVYPYSIMTSVFSPVWIEDQSAIKATFSAQEWCGHVYAQLNRRGGGYRGTSHSYFMRENDSAFNVSSDLIEEELWTRLRMGAENIPTGTALVLPSLEFMRLNHLEPVAIQAEISFKNEIPDAFSGQNLRTLEVHYPALNRRVSIVFEDSFPHLIAGWVEETSLDHGGPQRSVALRAETVKLDYWSKNGNSDRVLRQQLDLPIAP